MDVFYVVLGIIVIIATIYFLIKKVEARMVLMAAGLFMAIIAGKPMAAFTAFSERMVTAGLIQAILSVMGFAYVMKFTECDKHLVHLVAGGLKKTGVFLVPLAVLATFAINIALPSAAGAAAAVGAIFIPVMMAAGVNPAIAGAAVLAGTFGSMLNPGLSHNAFVGEITKLKPMEVVSVHATASIVSGIIAAVTLGIIAFIFKEYKGYETSDHIGEDIEKVKILHAIVPLVPVIILVLGATVVPALAMGVPEAMLIGVIVSLIVTLKSPTQLVQSFFNGMGKSYGDIMGIIIAASVFVGGLDAIGLVQTFTDAMIHNSSIVNIAATFGPFLLGVVSGSGDAAAFAFNEAVTPLAAQFGVDPVNMGSIAALGGALGRTMSPIAGAAIVCAGIAKVNPMELAKRNAPGMIIAAIVSMIILL
ncbi:C4-dicarboxylate transporter DcuC [Bacillus rubiinfantis]|uniref:C4-dicarboxylate transporter DcuC n=1 Tax=Bacillus rubiinfantis TaxID=1499680 RepID=UPI0005A6AFE4|nr:C4-dicarboxylate transporter DcuC [Bacillus rubiinfantis]